ncbi:MAG TPA: Sec-independent protein translocase protein TatB [Methylophilaceae bacterium]|jgi:sec-independent protein translocase protein TatB
MFDLAFSELIVIAIVALVVIGPEKLPKIARSAGRLVGHIQRYTNAIKADIDNELRLEDMQRLQDELRRNAEIGLPTYQVGQVIDHSQPQHDPGLPVHEAANADVMEPTAPVQHRRSLAD